MASPKPEKWLRAPSGCRAQPSSDFECKACPCDVLTCDLTIKKAFYFGFKRGIWITHVCMQMQTNTTSNPGLSEYCTSTSCEWNAVMYMLMQSCVFRLKRNGNFGNEMEREWELTQRLYCVAWPYGGPPKYTQKTEYVPRSSGSEKLAKTCLRDFNMFWHNSMPCSSP